MTFLLLSLASLSVTISMTIHVAANGIISFFSMAEYYPIVYIPYTYIVFLKFHNKYLYLVIRIIQTWGLPG